MSPTANETTSLVNNNSNDNNRKKVGIVFVIIQTIRYVAIIISIAMILAQMLTLAILDESIFQGLLRIYMFGFCITFIIIELNSSCCKSTKLKFLQNGNFILRGIMYSFIGVIGIEESETVQISTNYRGKVQTTIGGKLSGSYVWLSSISMFLLGIIYILMGICCLDRILYNDDDENENERHEQQQDDEETEEV